MPRSPTASRSSAPCSATRPAWSPGSANSRSLAVARHWSCQYEWHWHAPEAARAGLPGAVIEAIAQRRPPPLTAPDESTVYDFSCELQANRAVSDETYDKALDLLGPAGVVELTALNGYYAMIAMTLNEHRVPLPDGAAAQLPV